MMQMVSRHKLICVRGQHRYLKHSKTKARNRVRQQLKYVMLKMALFHQKWIKKYKVSENSSSIIS